MMGSKRHPRVWVLAVAVATMAALPTGNLSSVKQQWPPPAAALRRRWIVVTAAGETQPERENRERLRTEMELVLRYPVLSVLGDYSWNCSAGDAVLLVGRHDHHPLARMFSAAAAAALQFNPSSYMIGTVPLLPSECHADSTVLLATGSTHSAATHALSELRLHLRGYGVELWFDVPPTPTVVTPAVPVRAIYYNLGSGLNYGQAGLNASVKICAGNFDQRDWKFVLDKLVLAQYTDLYFFLWGDTQLVFGDSDPKYQGIGRAVQNIRTRAFLQQMIAEAHARGLKITYMVTPTLIPTDIFAAIASVARADISYAQPSGGGFSLVCPAVEATLQWQNHTWNSTIQLIRQLYRQQFSAFSAVDHVAMWFYDPGGCMCGLHQHNCAGRQADRMLRLVSAMQQEAQAAIPNLRRLDVDTWATWVFEGDKCPPPAATSVYRDQFFERLRHLATGWHRLDRPMVLDTIDEMAAAWGSGSTIPNATVRGFDTNGFLFGTNPESGYVFWMPSLDYLYDSVVRGRAWGVRGLHAYRFEEATKSPQTFLAGRFFAGRNITEAVRDLCAMVVGPGDKADFRVAACERGTVLQDEFVRHGKLGQNMTKQGAQIRSAFDLALPSDAAKQHGPSYLDMVEVMRTTGRAMALLGAGVDADTANNTAAAVGLRAEFITLMQSSAVFESFGHDAAGAVAKWEPYKRFLAAGWSCVGAGLGPSCF